MKVRKSFFIILIFPHILLPNEVKGFSLPSLLQKIKTNIIHKKIHSPWMNQFIETLTPISLTYPNITFQTLSTHVSQEYIDFIALQFCKYTPNTYIACLWPPTKNKFINETEKLLATNATIIYKKTIHFTTYLACENFTDQVPSKTRHGAIRYFQQQFSSYPLRIYVIEAPTLKLVKRIKDRVRRLHNLPIFESALHITDFHRETLWMAQIIFSQTLSLIHNPNAIFHKKPVKQTLSHLIEYFKNYLDDICIFEINNRFIKFIRNGSKQLWEVNLKTKKIRSLKPMPTTEIQKYLYDPHYHFYSTYFKFNINLITNNFL